MKNISHHRSLSSSCVNISDRREKKYSTLALYLYFKAGARETTSSNQRINQQKQQQKTQDSILLFQNDNLEEEYHSLDDNIVTDSIFYSIIIPFEKATSRMSWICNYSE